MKRFLLEQKLIQKGYTHIIGCDEVGRGALAGPVVAAAVMFTGVQKHKQWRQIADSKVLQPKDRERLSIYIKEYASWGIGVVEPEEIDQLNIHHASLLAMRKAVEQLQRKTVVGMPAIVIDGKFVIPKFDHYQEAVVSGDAKVHSIAAASIVAKVYRDALMINLHEQYQVYNFNKHKGYATLMHRSAIQLHGLSPVHRISFCGKLV